MPADLVRDLVSSRVGIVQSIAPQGRDGREPTPPYLYTATMASFDFRKAEPVERTGAGKGLTRDAAILSALGEAVERYCAYQEDPRRVFVASGEDVGPGAIRPPDLVLYSREQYARPDWPYVAWSEDMPIPWVQGVELPSGASVAAPAGLTYLGADPHPRFAPSTSNGLAAGASEADARLGGLCEVIERDAFLLAWMRRLSPVELDLARSGPLAGFLARHYARMGVDVRAYVLPTDLPATTVLALSLEDDPAVPGQVVGLGCHPSPAVALTKALLELAQGRPAEAHRYRSNPPTGRLNRYEDVHTLDDHSAFLSLHDRRGEFDFLRDAGDPVAVPDLPDPSLADAAADVDRCVAELTSAGYRVAAVDLTLPDIASVGLSVIRVLVTGLQPIHFGYGEERLGGPRLTAGGVELNPCPHPLA